MDEAQEALGVGGLGQMERKVKENEQEGLAVLVCDPDAIWRAGFEAVVGNVLTACEGLASLTELPIAYTRMRPTVVVVDPGAQAHTETWLRMLEALRSLETPARVLIWTPQISNAAVLASYRAGVLGCGFKGETPETLMAGMLAVAHAREYDSPRVAAQLARSVRRGPEPARVLSKGELAVFVRAADGYAIKDIAQDLQLSSKTVGVTLQQVRDKLGISNPADLTKLALEYGLINPL